jgi:hypothetical protein
VTLALLGFCRGSCSAPLFVLVFCLATCAGLVDELLVFAASVCLLVAGLSFLVASAGAFERWCYCEIFVSRAQKAFADFACGALQVLVLELVLLALGLASDSFSCFAR